MKNLLQSMSLPQLSSPSAMIQKLWAKFNKLPAGNKLFSAMIGRYIPYTGSISPVVLKIENDTAAVLLKDRKAVRNHLNSIHAIALANVGEFSTGLCVISQLSESAKAILVNIEVQYLKKARGDLIAEAIYKMPENISEDSEFRVLSNIRNVQNEVVCKVTATWRVRP
jgi:acyl-coenzyme A thioesterase PaaI-like protein